MKKKRELTAVGSYIFAGGFTLGVEKHFKILAHLEEGPYGVATFKLNRPKIPVYVGPETWPTSELHGRVNFVYCNPPCALFSVVGKSLRNGKDSWKTDSRRSCFERAFSLLDKIEPDALAIESVPLAFKRGREMLDEMAAHAMKRGYAVTHLLEDAQWYAVPQRRQRYMFIASRYGFNPGPMNWAPPTTVRETLEMVSDPGFHAPLRKEHQKLLKKMKPGDGLRGFWEDANPEEERTRTSQGVMGRPRFCEHRIVLDGTMGAFIGNFYIHPTEHRRLGIRECVALCGFPEDWKFAEDKKGFSELARGVMPNVAEYIARSVATAIHADVPSRPSVTVLDLRKPPKTEGQPYVENPVYIV